VGFLCKLQAAELPHGRKLELTNSPLPPPTPNPTNQAHQQRDDAEAAGRYSERARDQRCDCILQPREGGCGGSDHGPLASFDAHGPSPVGEGRERAGGGAQRRSGASSSRGRGTSDRDHPATGCRDWQRSC